MRNSWFDLLARALALLVLALVALPGRAEVRLPDGELYEQMDDLQVKVMGGAVTVSRSWFRNQWFFNSAWAPLKFNFDSLDGSVKSVERSGWVYERKTPGVFVFDKRNSIRATTNGYRWQDRRGNFIDYDAQGRIQVYGDRNNVRVSFGYDAQGHITRVLDHFSTQVLFLEWSGDQLNAIRDYTNRRVQYSYSGTRLTAVTDVLGNVWRYDYESTGKLNSLIDAEGRQRQIAYFANGRVATIVEADGALTQYVYDYDSAKRQIYCKIAHPDGRVEERWYDLRANLIRHDINGRTRVSLTSDGRTRLRIDENGAQVSDELDDFDNIIRHVNADGTTELYEYDPVYSNLLRYTDEAGVVTQNEYDPKGNLIRTTEAVGKLEARVTEYSYDAYGNVLTATRLGAAGSDAATFVYAYDDKGNETSLTDPEGNLTRYEFNVMGEGIKTIDARGKLWLSEYDAAGELLKDTDPLGNSTLYGLDKVGNVISATNARGKITRFEYDTRNRMRRMIDPFGNVDEMQYSAEGQLIKTIDRARRSERMEYDALGRLIRKIDAKGNATQLVYTDPGGGEVSAFGPTRLVYPTFENQLKYDKRNRVVLDTTVFGEEGLVTRYRYDLRGQVDALTDANGKTAFYEYDALGRLSKLTDTLGNITTYSYDNRNNLTAVRDANGHEYRFAYDRANRLLQETRPEGQSTNYRYDATDDLIELTRPGGERVQYDYDDAGRLIGVRLLPVDPKLAQISYSFAYDAQDNLITWSDGQFSATLTYDDLDRKVSDKVDYGRFALTYAYSYTANDLKQTLTLPSGVTYTYSYDDNDELAAVDIPGEGAITVNEFQWRAPKRVTLPGGTTQEMGYDGHLKLESLRVTSPAQQVVADLHNRYGKLEEINRRQLDGTTTDYGYDDEQRLTRVAPQGGSERTLALDPVANRTADSSDPSTWSYDENNRLIQRGTVRYAYDDNGNLTSKTDGTQVTRYFYDVQNRLVRIEDGAGNVIATYGYDPFDRRLWKEASGVRKYFLYADEGLLGEYTADGGEIFAYGWRPGGIWGAYPLFIKSAGEYFYAHNDQLGTPLKLTDKSGHVVWSARYDVFGQMTLAPGATIVNNLRFAGQYFDQESGLHYNFRRYYDPQTGRYITEDPVGLAGGVNLYAYVNGDPLNQFDPTGEIVPCILAWLARAGIEYTIAFAECFLECMGVAALTDLIQGDCFRPGDDGWPCAVGCSVPPFLRKWKWFKPPPCFRNSFPGDTLVHTEEGLKPIKDIKVGDKVLAWAEWKDETAYKPVTEVITGEQEYELVKITLENGEVIEATPGHPLYVHGEGWRDARLVVPGDWVDLAGRGNVWIKAVDREKRFERVYNLEVVDYHTYFASESSVLVHNGFGSYTIIFDSGMKYHGKGDLYRAYRSIKEKIAAYGEKVRNPAKQVDWTPASSNRRSFYDEAVRIAKDRGTKNPRNYNKRNSPGRKHLPCPWRFI